jgi:hypothetical protein
MYEYFNKRASSSLEHTVRRRKAKCISVVRFTILPLYNLAMAEVAIRQSYTAEARVRSQATSRSNFGGQNDTGTGFFFEDLPLLFLFNQCSIYMLFIYY